MTIEEKLKDYILSKYGSIRSFSIKANIPYTNINSILNRGIRNATWINVKTVANALNLDVDALADEEIRTSFRSLQMEDISIMAVRNALTDETKQFSLDMIPLSETEKAIFSTALETAIALIRKSRC